MAKAVQRKRNSKSGKRPAARRKSVKTVARKVSLARRAISAHRASAKRTKDPHGGLTAAGRTSFRKRDGSHLKPGVKKKKVADMTPQEMRRKGSWAVRFYGRAKLPPLMDKNGEPTRHALSANAWGEPVPKTVAAARKIAAKGHKLLDRYKRLQDKKARNGARKTGARTKARSSSSRKSATHKSATPKGAARTRSTRKTSARTRSTRKTSAKRSRKAA